MSSTPLLSFRCHFPSVRYFVPPTISALSIACMLAIAGLPLKGLAADAPAPASQPAPETAALQAEVAFLTAQLNRLNAERALQTAIDAPATAQAAAAKAAADAEKTAAKDAADKRDQRLTDTINAVSALSSKVPQGNYAATNDGVATPKAMDMAYDFLDVTTGELLDTLHAHTQKSVVIFVDAIPAPSAGYELKMYGKLMEEMRIAADPLLGRAPGTAQIAPAVLIAALPGVLNALAGFFRADYTEKIFDAKISSGTAVSSYIGQLLKKRATGDGQEIFLSLEAYALSKANIFTLPIVQAIGRMKQDDDALAAKLAALPPTKAQESAVVKALADLDEANAKIKDLSYRRDLQAELAKLNPANSAPFDQQVATLGGQIVALQATLAALKQTVEEAKAALATATEPKDKITALRAQIATLLTALRSTEGSPALFVRLVRDAFIEEAKAKSDGIRYIALSIPSAPQGTLTKKSFFGQTVYGSSFVALEYRVAKGNLEIVAAGIKKHFDIQKLPKP